MILEVAVKPRRVSDTIPKVDDDGARSSRRIPMDADVRFLHPYTALGVIVDVNDTGMRVVVDEPLEEGDRCVAVVQLADGEETHERAEVVWVRRTTRGWMMGLRFVA